eukprot:CAMPEP_0185844050 /NCGR_PEP_ID=MMETSP1354-20130828/363_1 /TAXON_ID=708628 /ORGANISM="Erythrolobus madagascarensis, Strain CCMP3276" /LENGTH=305 /DNA_ID=CAMNT_0028543659 /DNA_START=122 /DNA_END=1039 /DNA_ORIENTATION=+
MIQESPLTESIHAHGYHVHRKINSGAQGTVYMAQDRSHGTKVAVKVMKRTSKSTHRELHAIRKLSHESVVGLVDAFEFGESSVLVMDYLPGGDLFDWVTKEEQHLDADSLYSAAKHLLQSLAYIHSNGFAHRDIKLENVVMMRENDPSTLRLIDFGFAVPTSRDELLTTDYSGTLSYQPPEQILKQPFSPMKGDMWSLGVLLYTLLYKRLPFGDSKDARTKMRITQRRASIDPRKCPHISQRFLLLVQMLLNPVADYRPSAPEALKMVEGILAQRQKKMEDEGLDLASQSSTVTEEPLSNSALQV